MNDLEVKTMEDLSSANSELGQENDELRALVRNLHTFIMDRTPKAYQFQAGKPLYQHVQRLGLAGKEGQR